MTSPTVSATDFLALVERVNNLDAQIGLLVETLEQIVTAMEQDLVHEIDEVLGDQPDVSPAMVEALRAARQRTSN